MSGHDYQPGPTPFDRMLGNLDGLPGVLRTRPTTIRAMLPLGVSAETWIVQTVRGEDGTDTVFLEQASREGLVRLVLPAEVTGTILRQHEALLKRARTRAGKASAATRAAAGITPFKKHTTRK